MEVCHIFYFCGICCSSLGFLLCNTDLQCILMNGKTASDVERIDVAVPGVYVVSIGNRAVNVLVK